MTFLRNARVLSLMLFAAIGCDDSNANPEPDDTTITTSRGSKASGEGSSGKGGSGSSSAGSKASGSAGNSSSTSTGGSKSGSTSSSGDDAGMSVPPPTTSADDCKAGAKGCFCGAPTKDADYLNQCTAAMCSPFDNTKLKKRNADGSLPAIP